MVAAAVRMRAFPVDLATALAVEAEKTEVKRRSVRLQSTRVRRLLATDLSIEDALDRKMRAGTIQVEVAFESDA
jgi:hypothetical protein